MASPTSSYGYIINSPQGVTFQNAGSYITFTPYKSTNYYVTPQDTIIFIDLSEESGSFTVSLDASSSFFPNGKIITVKDYLGSASVRNILFDVTIDDNNETTISNNYRFLTLCYVKSLDKWVTI